MAERNALHHRSGQPTVTQARAYTYYDSTVSANWGYVDIYVGNPLTTANYTTTYPKLARMTIAMDINGYQTFDSPAVELMGQILPVSATLPAGATSVTVNTYR